MSSKVKQCAEKFVCSQENPRATVYCRDCDTYQCSECSKKIHSDSRNSFHTPENIKVLPKHPQKRQQSSVSPRKQADHQTRDVSKNLDLGTSSRVSDLLPTVEVPLDDDICLPSLAYSSSDDFKTCIGFSPYQEKTPEMTDKKLSTEFATITEQPTRDVEIIAPAPSNNTMTFDGDVVEIPPHSLDKVVDSMDLNAGTKSDEENLSDASIHSKKGFKLLDENAICQVNDENEFAEKLDCDLEAVVKVVSIFGNTGDGKSHTLNHTFFNGDQVFETSDDAASCTMGVWAAYDEVNRLIILDTEGMLGKTDNKVHRERFLLKVLALSDVVVYRTRAERLHDDMFVFLSDASDAYRNHFRHVLKKLASQLSCDASKLGPAVVVFHNTVNTKPLEGDEKARNRALSKRFLDTDKKLNHDGFSSLNYVSSQTLNNTTNFKSLKASILNLIGDCDIRAPRSVAHIHRSFVSLNESFNNKIEEQYIPFPERYFACTEKCLACRKRCCKSVNHKDDRESHSNEELCNYVDTYDNKVYICKKCYTERGMKHIVVPKVAPKSANTVTAVVTCVWSGYVLECPTCGLIYQSRQYWTGNPEPEEKAVNVEIRHIWPGEPRVLQGTHNAAQRVLDGVASISDTVSSTISGPTKFVMETFNDQLVRPAYWVANSSIRTCIKCNDVFPLGEKKHHCRACGQGVCYKCSKNKLPIPERGWGLADVRVCDTCYEERNGKDPMTSSSDDNTISARKVTEAVTGAVEIVSGALQYPKDIVKACARPGYWIPDEDCQDCYVCKKVFGLRLRLHHCRSCGNGVCAPCSPHTLPVPLRGWDQPVRVCRDCEPGLLTSSSLSPEKKKVFSARTRSANDSPPRRTTNNKSGSKAEAS